MKSLKDKTIALLNKPDVDITHITAKAKVGQSWLYGLRSGRFQDPGGEKVQRVYDVLTK